MFLVPMPLAPTAICEQADRRHARTAVIDSSVQITGAGRVESSGTLTLVWTGTDCIAWIRVRGSIAVDSTWRSVVAAPAGAFVLHQDRSGERRDYDASNTPTLTINGRPAAIGAEEERWVQAMVLEYVRRTGIGAETRAAQIAEAGLPALFDEVRHIMNSQIRARYLTVGAARVGEADRADFIHAGASLLDSAMTRGAFLMSLPAAWRADERVLAAVYGESAVIEPDEIVENVLRRFAPPRPTPAALRPLIEKLITTLQNSERRTALRVYYLDMRP